MRPIGTAKTASENRKEERDFRSEAMPAAVVLTVTVTMPPCNPSSDTELVEAMQSDSFGAPEQLMLTFPVKPPRGKTGRLKFPEPPAFKVRELALGVKV
jgi:hypothetical protein